MESDSPISPLPGLSRLTPAPLTLALVGAVGGGRLPGELVVARAAAVTGATTGVVLAVTLQPVGTGKDTDKVGVMTGMWSCCVTQLCNAVADLVHEQVVSQFIF